MSRPTPTRDAILAELRKGPKSDAMLARRLGRNQDTVRIARSRLHDAGKIHLAEFRREKKTGPWIRYWAAGPGEDAVSPGQLSPSVRCKNWRRKRRQINHPAGPLSPAALLGL